jgi:hypothetical protein
MVLANMRTITTDYANLTVVTVRFLLAVNAQKRNSITILVTGTVM